MDTQYEPGTVVFGSWYITKSLGEGSFGKVYEIQREDFGVTYKSALKVITVPKNQNEINNIYDDFSNTENVSAYFFSRVQEIVNEFVIMSKLKGESNIVNYEDHMVIKHENSIGWDILIKMELLTPLNNYIKTELLTINDVIKIGIDICNALSLCHRYNIIHRDVKPVNIFVSETGNYKLGDFGIAKISENPDSSSSKKGTYTYMAPEIYKNEPYNSNVDTYSLGLVMYRLMNNNKNPFMPYDSNKITSVDKEQALLLRMNGTEIPKPMYSSEGLNEIIFKACAYEPKNRFKTPEEMMIALQNIHNSTEDVVVLVPTFNKESELCNMFTDDSDCKTENVVENSISLSTTQVREKIQNDSKSLSKQFSPTLNLSILKNRRKITIAFVGFLLTGLLIFLLIATSNKPKIENKIATEAKPKNDAIATKISTSNDIPPDIVSKFNSSDIPLELENEIRSGNIDPSNLSPELINEIHSGNINPSTLPTSITKQINANGLDASKIPADILAKINSGTLDVSKLPPDVIKKVNSGEINLASLPPNAISKISPATLDNIPQTSKTPSNAVPPTTSTSNLSNEIASKINSGEIDISKLSPELVNMISASDISTLSNEIASKINSGEIDLSELSFDEINAPTTADTGNLQNLNNAINKKIKEDNEKPKYTIELKSNNNNYGKVYGAGTYAEGADISISAVPKNGYTFVKWEDGNTDAIRQIVVTKNASYSAVFKK